MFEDVTEALWESVSDAMMTQVVHNQAFLLSEWTRALEVGNEKLDTGMLFVSSEEGSFNTELPRNSMEIIGIMHKLLRGYIAWLENHSITVTVLSCRYVQNILENYYKESELNDGVPKLDRIIFKIPQLLESSEINKSSLEYLLVNQVLRAFVLGLCKMIDSTINMARWVLNEAEDITSRNLDKDALFGIGKDYQEESRPFIDFFHSFELDAIFKEIDGSIEWIGCQNIPADLSKRMIAYLNLMKQMNQIFSLMEIKFDIQNKQPKTNMEFLFHGLGNLSYLVQFDESIEDDDGNVPKGAFSRYVQTTINNGNIPLELQLTKNVHAKLKAMFTDIKSYIEYEFEIETSEQLCNFLRYDISHNINPDYSVLARGLFQMILIREDRLVLGSDVTVDGSIVRPLMVRLLIESLVGGPCLVFEPDMWVPGIQGKPDYVQTVKARVLELLVPVLQEIGSVVYHDLALAANNRCRQRQLANRSIILWDSAQMQCEQLETSIWDFARVGDEITNAKGDSSIGLPLLSWVYYCKLCRMLDLGYMALELNIYDPSKLFECEILWWYLGYLEDQLVEHLKGRVRLIIDSKIRFIEIVLPKRIKKLKAGAKKNDLRTQHQNAVANELPNLKDLRKYHEEFLIPQHGLMHQLCKAARDWCFLVMEKTNNTTAPTGQTDMKHIYELRMKPWGSIGVPETPTYEQYVNSHPTHSTIKSIETQLTVCRALSAKVNIDGHKKAFVNTTEVTKWMSQINESIDMYGQHVKSYQEMIETVHRDNMSGIQDESQ
ncbi:uncharacterized protein KQ657_003797 [Scheffersomyces spartinae]|uniref:Uncharacterized protein n=1 Tax=Scheffersomyces spartinae TaxID=45513 RepID=A0A9P8AJY1_9ASCO|nr:uncharacterized protein KQ657_003797 [Scheffersomyces spartinae]KAG7195271.1 hypothetical protein KQ657_003797 [Scheffersomyces spartinae]